MFQVRLHGRGGQGTVTAAELLSVAAFYEGQFAQAFPSFGSERMGAPVMAFCRIDRARIRLREPVVEPDAVLIQDATLLHSVEVFQGLREGGYVLVNTGKRLAELGLEDLVARLPREHVQTVAATEIALRHTGKPVPNAGLLGAFSALTGIVNLSSLEEALRSRFQPQVADANVAAARAAHASLTSSSEAARC
ncbi:MAG: 2-oxoacid:acceptor oxidoreductase family protein [Polyangiaceae bacterium]